MKIRTVKTEYGLVPETDEDKLKYNKAEYGTTFDCKSVSKRNSRFHRKFFSMVQLAWENCPESIAKNYPQQQNVPEKFWKELVKRSGYYEEQVNFKGIKEYTAKSIAFDSMDNDEFEDLYSAVLDTILRWIMPDTDRELIADMLANFG